MKSKKKVKKASPSYQKWWEAFRALCEHYGRGIKTKLHETLGVSFKHISQVYSGDAIASPKLMDRIAEFFHVTTPQMMEKGSAIIEELNKKPPEPFQGFKNVMSLPAKERYYSVWQLAAKHAGIQVALGAMGDPFFKDQVPKLETEEEVVAAYKEALTYWKNLTKRLDEELRKRGIRVEGMEDVINAEAEVVEEKELPEGLQALPEGEDEAS